MSEPDESTPTEAWAEDECLLCVPAPHPNCEMYTTVPMLPDPMNVPLGEDYEDHLVSVPVCLTHYQALEQFTQGRSVAEVTV